jgi:hypothetical protein
MPCKPDVCKAFQIVGFLFVRGAEVVAPYRVILKFQMWLCPLSTVSNALQG